MRCFFFFFFFVCLCFFLNPILAGHWKLGLCSYRILISRDLNNKLEKKGIADALVHVGNGAAYPSAVRSEHM